MNKIMRRTFSYEAIQIRSYQRDRSETCRTALEEAAYIRRTKLYHGNAEHAFTDRARDLIFLRSIVPQDAQDWVHEPHLRWAYADRAVDQPRRSAESPIRAWHVCADLPKAASPGKWMDEAELLVRLSLPDGVVADIAGHEPRLRPPHVHILIAHRALAGDCFGSPMKNLEHAIHHDLQDLWNNWLSQ